MFPLYKIKRTFILLLIITQSYNIRMNYLIIRYVIFSVVLFCIGEHRESSTSRSLVRVPISNESLYHATQKKNHGYSTSISMPTTRALIRAGIDSDVDQHKGHVCSKAATTRGVV